jgi:hypothetical protein
VDRASRPSLLSALKRVYGRRAQRNPQHQAQAGNQEAAGGSGEELGAQLEFPDRRCGRVYVSDQEKMLAEVRQADRQIKSGHYIKNEEMKSWLLSWGTDRELPVPKCAGGKHTMTRLCASRDCLIRLGANPAARNSSLYRAGQTGGGGTARHADCSHS